MKAWLRSLVLCTALPPCSGLAAETPRAGNDGAIQIQATTLPESSLLSEETRAMLEAQRERLRGYVWPCASTANASRAEIAAIRKCEIEAFQGSPSYQALRERYRVEIDMQEIGGVPVEVFTPADGVTKANAHRVLINLHGGGFHGGVRTLSHRASIPIAALGSIRVISIDYRLAPEYAFPAASEDVAAVYRKLIERYRASNIGIYGSSAGALLTAQAVVRLQREGLPRPAAVVMSSAAAGYWTEGDSGYLIVNNSRDTPRTNLYFRDADPNDPLAFPIRSPQSMAKFPPSLLITATRDYALSSVVHTHAVLVAQGVEADLHVWEGLGHSFYLDSALPESRQVYELIVKFFDRHLGRR